MIHALRVAEQGEHLEDVLVFLYGANDHFLGRIDARLGAAAATMPGCCTDACVSGTGRRAGASRDIYALPTTLTPGPDRGKLRLARHAVLLGPARLSSAPPRPPVFPPPRYQLYLYTLYALPALFAAMVFMAASFSLRLAREGGIAKVILFSAACGFGVYFFSDLTDVLGQSGAVPILLAATAPAIASILIGMTLVFNQEDG